MPHTHGRTRRRSRPRSTCTRIARPIAGGHEHGRGASLDHARVERVRARAGSAAAIVSAATIPAGMQNASRPAQEALRAARRPELLASARKKAGMPIVSVEVTVRWRGRKGKAIGRQAERRQEHRRVDGLRDEELGHPVGVAQDPAPLLDGHRHGGEGVGEEHEVGHALGHLAAVAHGDGQARLLQGEHVVDPVARSSPRSGPARVMARTRSRFCSGVMRPNTAVAVATSLEAAGLVRQVRPRRWPRSRVPARRRPAPRPGRWRTSSPEMTLSATPCAREVRRPCPRRPAATPSRGRTMPSGLEPAGSGLARRGASAAGQAAPPGGRSPACSAIRARERLGDRRRPARRERPVRPAPGCRGPSSVAPLHLRADEKGTSCQHLGGVARGRLGDGLHRGVARADAGGQRRPGRARRRSVARSRAVRRLHARPRAAGSR